MATSESGAAARAAPSVVESTTTPPSPVDRQLLDVLVVRQLRRLNVAMNKPCVLRLLTGAGRAVIRTAVTIERDDFASADLMWRLRVYFDAPGGREHEEAIVKPSCRATLESVSGAPKLLEAKADSERGDSSVCAQELWALSLDALGDIHRMALTKWRQSRLEARRAKRAPCRRAASSPLVHGTSSRSRATDDWRWRAAGIATIGVGIGAVAWLSKNPQKTSVLLLTSVVSGIGLTHFIRS